MKRFFEKYLLGKFGAEARSSLEEAKRLAELNVIQREKEITAMKDKQRGILKDMIKKHNILFVNNEPCKDEKIKCQNIIAYDKKKCNNEINVLDICYFSQAPYPFGITEKDILESLYNNTIRRIFRCKCGLRYNIRNKSE